MKIEIHAATDPAHDMIVRAEGKTIHQPYSGIFSLWWDIDDLSKLLSDKQIENLIAGEYVFNVPTWKIRLLQCQKPATTKEQLVFISQW